MADKLTRMQMEHAQKRIYDLAMRADNEAKVECSGFQIPNDAEFAQKIVDGEIKISPAMFKAACKKFVAGADRRTGYNHKRFLVLLNERYHKKEIEAENKKRDKEVEAALARREKIRAAREKALDTVVLGNQEAALKAIEEMMEVLAKLK